MKNLKKHGKSILKTEVTNISTHGIWILSNENELFLSYKDFPWFEDATIKKIMHVEQLSDTHLYWPDLDIDICLDSIEHPERFPLIFQD
jgi:hypothetical protein